MLIIKGNVRSALFPRTSLQIYDRQFLLWQLWQITADSKYDVVSLLPTAICTEESQTGKNVYLLM